MLTTYIYTLSDPESGVIRYVGKTAEPLRRRLQRHLIDKHNRHKRNWIQRLVKHGLRPEIEAIELASEDDWVERECYWIAFYRWLGYPPVNQTRWGGGRVGAPYVYGTAGEYER